MSLKQIVLCTISISCNFINFLKGKIKKGEIDQKTKKNTNNTCKREYYYFEMIKIELVLIGTKLYFK